MSGNGGRRPPGDAGEDGHRVAGPAADGPTDGPEGRAAGRGARGSGPAAAEDRLDFAVTTRRFLQDQINLADSKAGAVSTVSVLLLAYVVRIGSERAGLAELSAASPEPWLLLGGVLALGTGIAAALSVVVPRLVGEPDGLVFWQAILAYPSARDYADEVVRAERGEIVAGLLEDCHKLSTVCQRKYAALRWAMGAASLGLALSLLWLLLFGR